MGDCFPVRGMKFQTPAVETKANEICGLQCQEVELDEPHLVLKFESACEKMIQIFDLPKSKKANAN